MKVRKNSAGLEFWQRFTVVQNVVGLGKVATAPLLLKLQQTMRHEHLNVRQACQLFFCFVVIGRLTTAQAQERPPDPIDFVARGDAYLDAQARINQFSGSVLVATGEKTLYVKGIGLANIEHGVRNKPETKFRLGSITKQFTATAILLLEQQHKRSVEDPVSTHVSDCPDAWKPVTIH